MLAAGYGYSTVKQERLRWTDADGKRRSTSPRNHPVVAAHLAEMRAKASNRSGGELPLSPHQPLTPPTSHPTNLNPHQLTHQLSPLSPLSPRHTPTPLPTPLFCNPPFQQSRPPTALSHQSTLGATPLKMTADALAHPPSKGGAHPAMA